MEEKERVVIRSTKLLSSFRSVTPPIVNRVPHIGRNSVCICGSGKKYKHCCGRPLRFSDDESIPSDTEEEVEEGS